MTRKPQGALLEFKVSSPFFIIGLQASGDAYNSLHCSVVPNAKQSVKKRKEKKVWKELSDSPRSFSPTTEPCVVQRSGKCKKHWGVESVCWKFVSALTYTVVGKRIGVVVDYGGGKVDVSRRAPLGLLLHRGGLTSVLSPPKQMLHTQTGYHTEQAFRKILKDQRSKALVERWGVFCKHVNVSKYQLCGTHLLLLLNNKLQSQWKTEWPALLKAGGFRGVLRVLFLASAIQSFPTFYYMIFFLCMSCGDKNAQTWTD